MYIIIIYKLSYVHCEPLKRTPLKIAQRRDSTEDANGHIRRHVYVCTTRRKRYESKQCRGNLIL